MHNDDVGLPKYQTISDAMRASIINGTLKEGDRLPTEMELAEQYGVSRITSKKALDTLSSEGFVKRHPGKGSFVTIPSKDSDESKTGDAIPDDSKKRLIGIVMSGFDHGFGMGLLSGIDKEATLYDLYPVIRFSYGDENAEAMHLESLLELGVKGLIVMCSFERSYNPVLLRLSLKNFPIVMMDHQIEGLQIPYIGTDNYAAAKDLTDVLYNRGHKHIALASVQDSNFVSSVGERIHGFETSCINHGDDPSTNPQLTHLVDTNDDLQNIGVPDENTQIIRDFIHENPQITGFVAMSYSCAMTLDNVLRDIEKETGIHRDIACFDYPFKSSNIRTGMLHIVQHEEQIGRQAVQRLQSAMEGKSIPLITRLPYDIVASN